MFLLVQEQQDFYEESRRKIVRGAKTYVEAGIEQQRVELSINFLHVSIWTDPRNSWPQMPRNSFDTTTHFSDLQHRSELPRCFPSRDLVRDRDLFLDSLLCALCLLAVVMFVAYIHLFLWAWVRADLLGFRDR